MKHLAFILLPFVLLMLYFYMQSLQQAKGIEVIHRSILTRDNSNYTKDMMAKMGTYDGSESNLVLNVANQTLSAIERLYKKVFPGTKDQQPT